MTAPIIEDITLESLVGDLEVSCDYSEHVWCPNLPAKWVAFVRCPTCGRGGIRLICDCKEFLTATEHAVECACGEIVVPARKAFTRFEPLNRRPT